MTRQLANAARNGLTLNGAIIACLLNLKAVESADAIKRAFSRRLAETSLVGDWRHVQYELGLSSPALSGPPPDSLGVGIHLASLGKLMTQHDQGKA